MNTAVLSITTISHSTIAINMFQMAGQRVAWFTEEQIGNRLFWHSRDVLHVELDRMHHNGELLRAKDNGVLIYSLVEHPFLNTSW